jgi:hypothetical protein
MIKVNFYSLFIGFLVGALVMTTVADKPEVVIKHPTPYNTSKITYVDKTGTCYQYKADKIICPTDNSEISEIPVNV